MCKEDVVWWKYEEYETSKAELYEHVKRRNKGELVGNVMVWREHKKMCSENIVEKMR